MVARQATVRRFLQAFHDSDVAADSVAFHSTALRVWAFRELIASRTILTRPITLRFARLLAPQSHCEARIQRGYISILK
jgi:hypothetical protein